VALAPVAADRYRFLLVNALQPSISTLDMSSMIDAHYPYIAVPETLLSRPSVRQAQLMVKPHLSNTYSGSASMGQGNFHAVYFLPKHEIVLDVQTSTPLHVNDHQLMGQDPGRQDRTSVRWTADLSKLRPDASRVKRELVDLAKDPPVELVAAYLDITHGEVSVENVIGAGTPDKHHQFLNARKAVSRALGFQTVVELDVRKPPSIILRSRGPEPPLKLAFVDAPRYDLLIDNSMLTDITQVNMANDNQMPPTGPYYHYEVMYKLARTRPAKAMVPVPALPALDPPVTKCSPTTLMTK
jgi:hypothetical protein